MMQLDQSTVISLCSSGVVVVAMWMNNKTIISNLKEQLAEFKSDIKIDVQKEKKHAMELAEQRIGSVEKDVDEIFPRLRIAEENVQKNCIVLSNMKQACEKNHKV
jgi:uncharacterized protein YciU (UPF0263 family)